MYKTTCPRCGAENQIVNQCRCDPDNLPTRPTRLRRPPFRPARDTENVSPDTHGILAWFPMPENPGIYTLLAVPLTDPEYIPNGGYFGEYRQVVAK